MAVVPSSCILSKFYIKPQRLSPFYVFPVVVSYRNSTSNHNTWILSIFGEIVVSYRNSTSNHNMNARRQWRFQLYLIEILHQTTTGTHPETGSERCILSKFYIKPQRLIALLFFACCCILSKFYIKPQRSSLSDICFVGCILSKFYIKPQHQTS